MDAVMLNRVLLIFAGVAALFSFERLKKYNAMTEKSKFGHVGQTLTQIYACGVIYVALSILFNEKILILNSLSGETFGYGCVAAFFAFLAKLSNQLHEIVS